MASSELGLFFKDRAFLQRRRLDKDASINIYYSPKADAKPEQALSFSDIFSINPLEESRVKELPISLLSGKNPDETTSVKPTGFGDLKPYRLDTIYETPTPDEVMRRIKEFEEKMERAREEGQGDISQSTGGDVEIETGDSTPKDK